MTKTILTAICAATLLAGAVSGPAPARAEGTQPEKAVIGVIDAQEILRESSAMKGVRTQIEKERRKFQAEVTAEERKLRAEGDQLRRQRGVLAPKALQRKGRALQARVAKVQQRFQQKQREIDKAFSKTLGEFQAALNDVVTEIAKERGYNLVLYRRQVVFVKKEMLFTDEALKRLNKRLPVLSFKIEEPKAPKKKPAAARHKTKKKKKK
jgi:outer membrane protein